MVRRFLEWLVGLCCKRISPPKAAVAWEYTTLWFTSQAKNTNLGSIENCDSEHVQQMCALGKDGWELISTDLTRGVFKRQKKT
jgi:hypothetical protein